MIILTEVVAKSKPVSTGMWIGAITGGLAGTVVSLCMQWVLEALRIWRLSKNILLYPEQLHDASRIRVLNLGLNIIEDAIVDLGT